MRAAVLVVVLGTACAEPDRPTSALLVTIDTTNVGALGCYGQAAPVTPNLDRLAREGLVYDNARTVAPMTLPSHASMLTGLYPLRHTVRDNGRNPLPASAVTVAELASERGYQTAAFVAAVVLAEPFGLGQGFDTYDAPRGSQKGAPSERLAADVTERALAWLAQRDPTRPFLLWVHYFDPHAPYAPDRDHVDRISPERDLPFRGYLGEVAQADASIGRLIGVLAANGDLDDTLVMVVADHGEALGAHGEATHSLLVYDATIRVPFLVRYPDGHRAGERSDEPVSVVDVHPTLVDALELDAPDGVDGRSLFRRSVPEDRGVYFESLSGYLTSGWSPLAGWADARGTYLHGSDPELYAPDDREQRHDRIERRPELARAARARLAEIARRPALVADGGALDDELVDAVRGLGYLGSDDVEPGPALPLLDVEGLPNPRERIGEWSAVFEAAQLGSHGKLKAAVELLEGHLERYPGQTLALETLCTFLTRMQRDDRVIDVLWPLAADGLERHVQVGLLGGALEREGRRAEAREVYARAVERWPDEEAFRAGLERVQE